MTWLIASLGTSPSVLTEALWYLETKKGLRVDRLTCVGTRASFDKAEKDGMFAKGGALDRLRKHLRTDDEPTWLTRGHGLDLIIEGVPDNRDLAEAKVMDATFRRVIREAQEDADHDGPVIACISGGRKTMSSSLQQAMALLARREDWAFHVLLNLPQGVDEDAVFRSGFAFPGDPSHPALAKVQIDAFEVPLVRLRELAATKKINLADDALVESLQKAVDDSRTLPRLTLELQSLILKDETRPGWSTRLEPQFALLLAAFKFAGKSATLEDLEPHFKKVLELWRTLKVKEDTQSFPTNLKELQDAIDRWMDPTLKEDGTPSKTLEPRLSNLKKALLAENPSYHFFTLRATGRGEGRRGFDQVVYDQQLLSVTV